MISGIRLKFKEKDNDSDYFFPLKGESRIFSPPR
jgi:hypothetical protein